MIEINLLPEDIRTTEGTPLMRFLLYIGFLMFALLLGFFIVNYRQVQIPNMQVRINQDKVDIEKLKKLREDIDKVTAEIDSLNKRIQDLDELNLNRVRFARLFDRLTNAMPEGVWFRSFSFTPDSSVSLRYAPAGRRYAITMNGNSIGATQQDRNRKVTDLISNINKQFNIPPEGAPVPNPVPEDYGFCKFVGARFEPPRPSGIATTSLAGLQGPDAKPIDPKLAALINPPKEGSDFTLTVSFDMPAVKSAQ